MCFILGLELELGRLEMAGGHRTGGPDVVMGGYRYCFLHVSCRVIETSWVCEYVVTRACMGEVS